MGCILTQQLPFQTYLASYFVFVDMTLVAQYIYYYKPAPASTASTPCQSRDLSPSPTGTPTIILSPTTYSPRNLTRPSSRTPLLTAGEIEAGFGSAKEYKKYRSTSHTSVRSHHRPHTSSSSRFAGVSAAYPPAGLLPTADEISASGSGTVRARSTSKHRQSDKDGFLGLRRQAEGSESRSRTRNDSEGRRNKNGEKQHFHLTDGEGDDEMSGLTDSFYSEASHASRASHPNAGVRRVSWSQAPPLIAPLTTTDQQGDTEATSPSGEGEDGDVTPMMAGNTPTPHGILQAAIGARQSRITTLSPRLAMSETSVPFAAASVGSTSASAEDLRQRSRSRGRTMSRPSPIAITPANVFINVTGDGLSPSTAGPTTEPTGSAPGTSLLRCPRFLMLCDPCFLPTIILSYRYYPSWIPISFTSGTSFTHGRNGSINTKKSQRTGAGVYFRQ